MDRNLTRVPQAAKPVREIHQGWIEPSVWTERMLRALNEGVKGGRWYSLFDKVAAPENLRAAAHRVAARRGSAGVDHVTTKQFIQRLDEEIDRLHRDLLSGRYRPQAIRRVWIEKPGGKEKRPLGIPTVRDRVVQTALRHVLEPIFERTFAESSYGFRPQRGCHDALRRVEALLRAGYVHVVDVDLKSYFDTIPQPELMVRVCQEVADGKVLRLIETFLQQDILDGMSTWRPEQGVPQGAVISPLLSNIYLTPLDHQMAQAGYEMVRYADDLVVLCRSQTQANAALAVLQRWTVGAGLRLHPTKTRLVSLRESGNGFDFLGYHFAHTRRGRLRRWPRKRSLEKFKASIRAVTRRANGHSLGQIIGRVNEIVRGWFGYFKHSYGAVFERLDGWIRMRIRSILRKRQKRRGRARGRDRQRWPNAYFAQQGLFSMAAACEALRQSCYR